MRKSGRARLLALALALGVLCEGGEMSAPPSGKGGISDRIAAIEEEMRRTQKNKATEGHLGLLKARLAKLRTERDVVPVSAKGDGFECGRHGDARIALLGFPSVGKSSMFSLLTNATSEAAAYEFTTLTCIPGVVEHRQCKMQLLDLPGIIAGAARGVGRGRQVIAVARSADVVLMVLDATRPDAHRAALEAELATCGIRLNQKPPDIFLQRRQSGGLEVTPCVGLTKTSVNTVKKILTEYKVHNADLILREDVTIEQVIDFLEGNCVYIKCLYCYNKVDVVSLGEWQRAGGYTGLEPCSCPRDTYAPWDLHAGIRMQGQGPALLASCIFVSIGPRASACTAPLCSSGSGFRVQGSGFRVQGSGFRV